jgi:hypothetical protein
MRGFLPGRIALAMIPLALVAIPSGGAAAAGDFPFCLKGCDFGNGDCSFVIAYPAEIRKAIYTTNVIESLNMSLRKIIKTRGSFPNDEAALKLLFLAMRQVAKKWTMPVYNWRAALNHFTILWPDRMPALERNR